MTTLVTSGGQFMHLTNPFSSPFFRIDQWSVYADMVIKNGEHDTAREIFERMINLGLTPKKMKSLFKKYWEFEQTHGDQAKEDAVRKKALEYLEKQNVQITEDDDPIEQMEIC